MSALAMFSEKFGATVSGSDMSESAETRKLQQLGVDIKIGHDASNISTTIDYVIYTAAIPLNNVELIKANELNIPCIERSEFLGVISGLYSNSIVVAGTHGKTTTTAMIGEMFINANKYPSIHLGGESIAFGNYLVGNQSTFITEGCEYKNSIRYLSPHTTVITSIELDHTDCYKSKVDVEYAFLHLANNTKENVIIFENKDFARSISAKVNVFNVGFGDGYDIAGKNVTKLIGGGYSFDVYFNGLYMGKFQSNAVGIHNAGNTLCAIAVALLYGIDISTIYKSTRAFKGVKRRFERVGSVYGVPVICDYAHHPTEIYNSIKTAKTIFGKVNVIFQPHTYSRTIGLKKEFIKNLKAPTSLAIYKTYPAREKYMVGGSAKELFNVIQHSNKTFLQNKKALKQYLINMCHEGCILVLGAGDIYYLVVKILKSKDIPK